MITPLPILRIARPTNHLDRIIAFYCQGLGFQLLTRFDDHAGFSGAIVGHPQAPWHLEFTHEKGVTVGPAPSSEHLLVLYVPERQYWLDAVDRLRTYGLQPVASHNPYWDKAGQTFIDPDGYRIVLQNAAWTK